MLISEQNITNADVRGLGAKTLNLKRLVEFGLKVPPFCAVPAETVKTLSGKTISSVEMVGLLIELKNLFSVEKYVVRSSALVEDDEKKSYAGQFMTKINLSLDEVANAILEIIDDAVIKLNGNLDLFSIIIQEYIPADVSGVCFTRDPLGNRNMIIEYHKGIGEDLVSGKVKPERVTLLWSDASAEKLPDKLNVLESASKHSRVGWQTAIETFKTIEQEFKKPQDIEWVVSEGVLYFVQTRPITTLNNLDYEGFLYLDKTLSLEPFLYEKTEISEIAPRPTPFTLSLLQKIYSTDGPVSKVYARYGVKYISEDFLKIVGNELYVDRELEIQTLLPAYSYLKTGTPKLSSPWGLLTSFFNIINLNRVSRKPDSVFEDIKSAFSKPLIVNESLMQNFLNDYELIFEVNLLAARALKTLELFAQKEHISAASLLQSNAESPNYDIQIDTTGWLGNSLEVGDVTPFYAVQVLEGPKSSNSHTDAILSLSKVKQAYISPRIAQAQAYSRFREYGRWLTVKYVNALREQVKTTHPEQLQMTPEFEQFSKFNFPKRLTNISPSTTLTLMAVSSGVAEGILKSAEQILPEDKNIILYTKVLAPELTKYFPQLTGIVSEQGGLLSHLAIIAREQNLPVLVNYDNSIPLGSKVKIDCEQESIAII